MVNRKNYQAVKDYLRWKVEVENVKPMTIDHTWSALKMFLIWSDATEITDCDRKRPTFPKWVIEHQRSNGHTSTRNQDFIVMVARNFAQWASVHKTKSINSAWVDSLRLGRQPKRQTEHQAVTPEMVQDILSIKSDLEHIQAAQAAAAFLFLSGMRITAFMTMPIACFDATRRTVIQSPERGMRTKFDKAATTTLLDIPEFMEVVWRWDERRRREAIDLTMEQWYWTPNARAGRLASKDAGCGLRHNLKWLFETAGHDPMSPHKFRHGHAVYALTRAHDVADLKAISQNLMHSNLGITDGIYAILGESDMQARIAALGNAPAQNGSGNHAPVTPDTPGLSAIIEEAVRRALASQKQ